MIVRITENKLKVFRKLYELGFGFANTSHDPQDLFVQFNEAKQPVIMYAGYSHSFTEWYLQYSAKLNGDVYTPDLFKEFLLHQGKTHRFIMCAIESTNIAPLIRVLKTGFIIQGTRTPLNNNKVLVECILDTTTLDLKGIQ